MTYMTVDLVVHGWTCPELAQFGRFNIFDRKRGWGKALPMVVDLK